jgi:Tol biopolymer transport system component
MALPFDAARLKATAEAFPVAENVAIAANNRYGAYSLAGNGTLAYWGRPAANSRGLVWMDRSGKRLGPLGNPNIFGGPALSPDEKTVAASVGPPTQRDIWLLDSASESITRFTFGFTGFNPVWTPDGRSLVYARQTGLRMTSYAGRSRAVRKSCYSLRSSTLRREMFRPTGNSSFTT